MIVAELAPFSSTSLQQEERLIGYALYYFTYTALQGRVINLEDIFIKSEYRGETIKLALVQPTQFLQEMDMELCC